TELPGRRGPPRRGRKSGRRYKGRIPDCPVDRRQRPTFAQAVSVCEAEKAWVPARLPQGHASAERSHGGVRRTRGCDTVASVVDRTDGLAVGVPLSGDNKNKGRKPWAP